MIVRKKAPQQIFNKVINTPLLVEQIHTYIEKEFEDFEYVFSTLFSMLEYSDADSFFENDWFLLITADTPYDGTLHMFSAFKFLFMISRHGNQQLLKLLISPQV